MNLYFLWKSSYNGFIWILTKAWQLYIFLMTIINIYLQRYILPLNNVHLIEPPQRCIFHRMKYFLLLHPCHCVWWTSFHDTWKLSSIKTCGKVLRLSKKKCSILLYICNYFTFKLNFFKLSCLSKETKQTE